MKNILHIDLMSFLPDDVLVRLDRALVEHGLETQCTVSGQGARGIYIIAWFNFEGKLRNGTCSDSSRLGMRSLCDHIYFNKLVQCGAVQVGATY
jgi:hypothetical protein